MEESLLIGEIAKKTKIAPSTIRYYESIGLLPQAKRVNGRRIYSTNIIASLKLIRAAQQLGWQLNEIKELLVPEADQSSFSSRWQSEVPKKLEELDSIIRRAETQKQILTMSMTCECSEPIECKLLNINV